ncbi:MAG: hypothetical protein A3J48_03225 [Candidatus Doudnabacteria bacterium RIFCSPHIGHO2_02_FULL_46_11]|uniref:DUF1761 domain-containing protein n=1 Tax=Candidatus Doudnabacteria bacterium RIFCSPHIGHO2_02_FULL_46_11 TaxID=1817832 RepID=A0A1F5P7W4_9BACT|nr:MAG: hypothetical protein A3J48_03225 [Candidatus Doudnabacteria bacterium RIFCSPHIGHO2_02_FULL_46_11]
MNDVNLLAVLVAAVASMIIGSIWYGPLFGKQFIQAMGMDKWSPEKQAAEKKKMGMTYALQFVGSLVMFYVLAGFIGRMGDLTLNEGVITALWVWIGFAVPFKLAEEIWGGNMKLFWIGIGSHLVTLLAAGAIIGAWA